uniref:Uncharacterized protein n=1 Tax=Bactrocera latifrons TaxID=174628 RepID=A0A0K8UTD0_BACLA
MLRTPTHIVELSTNTTSPLLQKFHVGAATNGTGAANGSSAVGVKASSCAAAAAAAATAVQYHQQQQQQKQTSNKFFNDRQQQQEQHKQTTGYRFQAKGMKITTSSSSAAKEHLANATTTTSTAPTASTPISAARSLLSSTPFISFKRIKKIENNNNKQFNEHTHKDERSDRQRCGGTRLCASNGRCRYSAGPTVRPVS